jgi:hypothetical protein
MSIRCSYFSVVIDSTLVVPSCPGITAMSGDIITGIIAYIWRLLWGSKSETSTPVWRRFSTALCTLGASYRSLLRLSLLALGCFDIEMLARLQCIRPPQSQAGQPGDTERQPATYDHSP